jgi:putative membrane protein
VRHGPRAHRRRHTRVLIAWALLAAALLALWWAGLAPGWAWEALPVLVALGAVLAYDRYRSLGHALVGRTLVTRRGSLVRRRCMLACDGVIGWNLTQSFFQRRVGLATLTATTAAGRQQYAVQDVPVEDAVLLASEAVPSLLEPFLVRGTPVSPGS